MRRISVIIVNFNGRRLLADCLGGLEAQTRKADEVILVDNGSTDGSVELVRRDYPWVRVIESGVNLGFAGGNNLGIQNATGDYVVLLNNDTFPGPGFIEAITRPLDDDHTVSAVAGVLLFTEAPEVVASSGIEVYSNGLALDRDVNSRWRELPREFDVFGPSGGAMAIRRDVLDDIGLFPEPFFLYLEDVDLAWRMRLRGCRTVASRGAWALHIYSASAHEASGFKDFHLARNRAWTLIRCWPGSLWRKHWWAVLKYEIAAVAYGVLTARWQMVSGRFRGWTSYFRLRLSRRAIQSRATASDGELLYWIHPGPSVRWLLGMRRSIKDQAKRWS